MLLDIFMDAVMAEVTGPVCSSCDYVYACKGSPGAGFHASPLGSGERTGLREGKGRLLLNREHVHAKCTVTRLPIMQMVDYEEGHVEYAARDI